MRYGNLSTAYNSNYNSNQGESIIENFKTDCGHHCFPEWKDHELNTAELNTAEICCNNDNEYIDVENAIYGRTEDNCNSWKSDCNYNVKSIVKEQCNMNNECTIKDFNDKFGDPCSGTNKTLKIDWDCKPYPANYSTQCISEYKEFPGIQCGENETVNLIDAQYGEYKEPCHNILCGKNVTHTVKDYCNGNECSSMKNFNKIFHGDPCLGKEKHLNMVWSCCPANSKIDRDKCVCKSGFYMKHGKCKQCTTYCTYGVKEKCAATSNTQCNPKPPPDCDFYKSKSECSNHNNCSWENNKCINNM